MAAFRQSRRSFLISLTLACAAVAGVARYLRPRPASRKVLLDTPLADIPVDSAMVFSDKQLVIIRNGKNLYALSLVCTHLGCTLSVTPSGLYCPCHGSSFNRDGQVLKGPATSPLKRLAMEIKGERVIVIGDTV